MMGYSPAIPLGLTLRYAQRRTFIAKYAKKGREGREEEAFRTRTGCYLYLACANAVQNSSERRRRLTL